MFRIIGSALLALCAAAASAVPARADEMGMQTKSIVVSYADLDLGSAAGAQTLLGRIKVASRHVCGDRPSPAHLRGLQQFNTCIRGAMSGAVQQVGSMSLNAQYFSQNEQKVATR